MYQCIATLTLLIYLRINKNKYFYLDERQRNNEVDCFSGRLIA